VPGAVVDRARWQTAVAVFSLAAAAAAVWVTLDAGFLRYPGWLAAQKADFVVGPVLVGLYWVSRRPRIGVVWENVIYLATEVLILAFPTGRLDGLAPKLIVLGGFIGVVVPATIIDLVLPQVGAGASISACRTLCPENALAVTSDPSLAQTMADIYRPAGIAVSAATAALLVWRLVNGTPPQRRALAVGTPVALLFLMTQVTYQLLSYAPTTWPTVHAVIRWGIVGSRALIWYGFLLALVAAELFAARALRRLVAESLRRPRQRELEAMLREPLGDPHLRLVFLEPGAAGWPAGDGRLPQPEPGQTVTVVDGGDGRTTAALVHDAQLDDAPELLHAAGAVALLAAENAELDAAWNDALQELQRSRARIVRAADAERRRLERDLHDGVQQRLTAIMIEFGLVADIAPTASEVAARLATISDHLEEALDELRDIAHGLYPPILGMSGLPAALERLRLGGDVHITVDAAGVGRHAMEIESAVYYCCSEAVQNAIKHAAHATRVSVTLHEDDDELTFKVSDDGDGFDASTARGGLGLQNMRDRIGALYGRLSVVSEPLRGTVVTGSIPLQPGYTLQPGGGAVASA
jgi:signal transduction histidine kinase